MKINTYKKKTQRTEKMNQQQKNTTVYRDSLDMIDQLRQTK